jgi:Fungal specific transcription factor domain
LRSHRQYAALLLQKKKRKTMHPAGDSTSVTDGWPHLLIPSPEIGREGVDGFPFMPIPDQLDPELRDLFHHFFKDVFDRLVLIFRAPPIAKDFKPRMLQIALTTPSYCYALIAQSRIDNNINRDQFTEDRQSLALYGKVLEVYRKHLTVMQPAHVDILLLVIVVLLTYDMVHGRRHSPTVHWNGMQQLVSFRGGIHNIGVSLAYVVHADRVIATFHNKPPAYPLPADRSIQLTRPPKSIYGSAFESLPSLIDSGFLTQRTFDYCLDTVRLLELFESTKMSFDPEKSAHSRTRNAEYFYYSRDRLDGQFPILHAELHGQNTKEYCIVLAARLAEYPITWTNYIPTLTILLADQLRQVLELDEIRSTWDGHINILSWILFVATIAPLAQEKRSWLLNELGRTIAAKYGLRGRIEDVQAEVWRAAEWENARTFIWSDTHMRDRFDKVCDELEATWCLQDVAKTEQYTQTIESPDLW